MKYQKRISWDRHRPEFFKIGLILALAISFMAFNYTTATPDDLASLGDEPIPVEMLITPPITVQKKDSPPPPPPPPLVIKTIANVEPATEPIVNFEPKVEVDKVKEYEVDEYANTAPVPTATKVEIIPDEVEEEEFVIMADRMPVYGDCDLEGDERIRRSCTNRQLLEHTYATVKYPPLARDIELEGVVVVSFVVNKEGDVQDIKIVKDIGMGCGEEVVKALKTLKKFYPGKQNGRPVNVIYRLPVKFKLI